MAVNLSTENKTTLSSGQAKSVGTTAGNMQQAHRVANASTATPTVRHQASPQADPNKLSRSLESISNAVGKVAQDTYSLNNALVDEMASDDTAMMVHGLDEMDRSLKPGESRDRIIKAAGSYRGNLIAKKGDFDGNEDMQARYREKFINPSAAKTMAYMKKWTNEEHTIEYGKLKEEFTSFQTNEMPLRLKGLSGQALEDEKKAVTEQFNKYVTDLATYGDMGKTQSEHTSSKRMTSNLFADFRGNYADYVGAGYKAIISTGGTVDGENLAAFLNDKYYVYGTFKDDGKGWVSTDFKTDNTQVREEITSALGTLKTAAKSAASGVQKEHTAWYNNLSTMLTTPGTKETSMTYGSHTFDVKYMNDPKYAREYANEQFKMVFGYSPSIDTQKNWMGIENQTEIDQNRNFYLDIYTKNPSQPVDVNNINPKDAKKLFEERGSLMLSNYQKATSIIGDKNAQYADVMDAKRVVEWTQNRLNDNSYQNEMLSVMGKIKDSIFTNPTTAASAEMYKANRNLINTQGGQQFLRAKFGSVKEYNKALLYSALYEQAPEDQPFSISTELSNRINAMADGRLTKSEIELIQGYSLREDTMNGNKYMTPDEAERQLLINKTKLLLNPEGSIDYTKNDFGSDPYFTKNEFTDIAGVKPTTSTGAPALHAGYMDKYKDPETGEFTYKDNLEKKVVSSLMTEGKNDAADAVIRDGFILEEIAGAQGQYYIYSGKSMMRLNAVVNLLGWNGRISKEVEEREFRTKKQKAEQILKDQGNNPFSLVD